MVFVAGLDLAGSPRRCSGYSVLNFESRRVVKVKCLYDDDEVVSSIKSDKVTLVAIDAPIAENPVYRDVDRVARSLGYPVIPPTLGPMRLLTRRAWTLYQRLTAINVNVIETHPRSALISSGCSSVVELLSKLRLGYDFSLDELSKDEVDAIIASIVAYCYLLGTCVSEVRGVDGVIYLISRIP